MHEELKDEIVINHRLPTDYDKLNPLRRQEVLRAAILRYLNDVGRANTIEIKEAIGAPSQVTVTAMLRELMARKQIYGEPRGSKEWDYMPNGRLAHPLMQSDLDLGLTSRFEFRTYSDRYLGSHLVIVEYRLGPRKEPHPTGGIRVDLTEIDAFIERLEELRDNWKQVKDGNMGLIKRRDVEC